MPPGDSLGLGKSFCAISMSFFRNFYIRPILNLVTANDRYKNSSEGFFIGPPLGVDKTTNLVEKMEKLSNHKSDFRSWLRWIGLIKT